MGANAVKSSLIITIFLKFTKNIKFHEWVPKLLFLKSSYFTHYNEVIKLLLIYLLFVCMGNLVSWFSLFTMWVLGWNSGPHAWWQSPLSTEPSQWPPSLVRILYRPPTGNPGTPPPKKKNNKNNRKVLSPKEQRGVLSSSLSVRLNLNLFSWLWLNTKQADLQIDSSNWSSMRNAGHTR